MRARCTHHVDDHRPFQNNYFVAGGNSDGPERVGLRRVIGRGHQEHFQLLSPLLVVARRRHSHRSHPRLVLHLVKVRLSN